ncbi:MAG: phosphatase PAP2 family protein [Tannerellaceae bacterium]|nr:phosphatase PAP2 family protein [Tannerellaceae bacterium]
MLENILAYERDLFLLLNGSHTAFLDGVAWLYSGRMVWIPLVTFLLAVLIYKVKWQQWAPVLLGFAVVVLLCDQFSSHICKPLFTRLRPTHHPDFMEQVHTVFGYRGGKYGFISGHSANAFGVATFFALLFRTPLLTVTVYVWATLMAYSRIYLGVHFISDVVPGVLSGIFFGYLSYILYVHCCSKYNNKEVKRGGYSVRRCRYMAVAVLSTMLTVILFSPWLVTLTVP